MSVTELAYRWLAHREIQSVIAGPRVVDHLSDAWKFVQDALAPALLTEVDEISATHTGTALSYAR
jgi:aryl-alcohol dehydrogenase-like predicted oxidoreductase